jgi:hypothetical protein
MSILKLLKGEKALKVVKTIKYPVNWITMTRKTTKNTIIVFVKIIFKEDF